MNKLNFSKALHDVKVGVIKHSPEILTGLGIAGTVITVILAVKATPKALELKEAAEKEKGEKLTPIETVKVCWKPYVPTFLTGGASVTCLIGSTNVSLRRNAALTAAYKISETALTEYKAKVVETIGEKKEKVVREKLAEDQVQKKPVKSSEIFVTEKGNTIFLDTLSQRHFKSDFDKIRRVVAYLNNRMSTDPFDTGISLNDFYSEVGLTCTDTGSTIGWRAGNWLEIDFIPTIDENEDGEITQVIVLDYCPPPVYGFDKP